MQGPLIWSPLSRIPQLSDQEGDVLLHGQGELVGVDPFVRFPVPVDEELLEIPADVVAVQRLVEETILATELGCR